VSDGPGFFERLARKEYDDPVTWNAVPLGTIALFSVLFADYRFALMVGAVILIRIWGMRPGGYIRRRYQRKYGWD
jgi:hypothetical protein